MTSRLFVILLCLCFTISKYSAQDFNSDLNALQNNYNLVGLAVGIRCQGEAVGAHYSGLRNVENKLPVNENTKFRVASISKSFTAAALLVLYDDGYFELDDDISEALGYTVVNPNFPETTITYRMLLSHRSSLQDGDGYGPFLTSTYSNFPFPNISEVLLPDGDFYTPNMWRTEQPGSYFAYSNISYGLIGTLIEALSGIRFDLYVVQNILDPLGIEGNFNVAELENIENLAALYRDNVPQADDFNGVNPNSPIAGFYTPGTNGAVFAPQGGLRCSLSDLLNFGEMLANQGVFNGIQILQPETAALMISDQWTYNQSNGDNYFGLFNSWGLGIHRAGNSGLGDQVIPNEMVFGHPGEAYGLISDLYIHPGTGMVFAFLTNGYTSGGGYSFGNSTSYYAPEEDAFGLIHDYFWDGCKPLSSPAQSDASSFCSKIKFNWETSTLSLPAKGESIQLRVFDSVGKTIFRQNMNGSDIKLPKHTGLSILEITTNHNRCTQRIVSY